MADVDCRKDWQRLSSLAPYRQDTMRDRWHTAVHEAGHAVVGRVLGVMTGVATITAGHPLVDDPWCIVDAWERRGRLREIGTVFRGQALTLMAGAEAEMALLGECEGGDRDRGDVAPMLAGAGLAHIEDRLRRATRILVRRHVGKIDALARALWVRETIVDDGEIRAAAGLGPAPAEFDYWAGMGFDTCSMTAH